MKNSNITILRTSVGCTAAIGLIKKLRKRKIRIVGIDCEPLSAGFTFCDKSYVVPKWSSPRFLKEILRICDIEKPKVIISGPEEELLLLSKNKELFEKKGVLVLTPEYETVRICADKFFTHEFFKKENIPVPEVYRNKRDIKFPIIIKPRFGRGGVQVFKVCDKDELKFYLKKVKDPIFQEFIDGTEYTIDIFADLDGKPLSVVPRVRIQVESGISMKGKTVFNKEIMDYCREITEKLKLSGPSCIQCIKNKKTLKFIEINPRFGGGSILSIKADLTVIPNLIKIIKGLKPKSSKGFKRGLVMLRYYSEIYSDKL